MSMHNGTVTTVPLPQIGNSIPYGGGTPTPAYQGIDWGALPPEPVPLPFDPHTRREWLIGQALRGGAGFKAKEIADAIEAQLVKEEQAEDVVDAFEGMP